MFLYFIFITTSCSFITGFIIGYKSRIINKKTLKSNRIIDGILLGMIYVLFINTLPLLLIVLFTIKRNNLDKNLIKNTKTKHNDIITSIHNRFKHNETEQFEYWCPEGLTFIKTNDTSNIQNLRKRKNLREID